VQEIVGQLGALLQAAARGQLIQQGGEVAFQIGLETPLFGAVLARDQPPQPAVGQDGEREPAAVEIPFDLFGRVFAPAGRPAAAVEADVPGLGVGQQRGVVPKRRLGAAGLKRAVQVGVVPEEGVIRLTPLEIRLVLEPPAERAQHGLEERFFQTLLVPILVHPLPLYGPKFNDFVQGRRGSRAEVLPFRLPGKPVSQPVVGEQTEVANRAERQERLVIGHRGTT
jgi:hypothetical protein